MASRADETRFRDLYEVYHPAINAYFIRRIGSQDSADATDDVFTVAWRRLQSVPDGHDALLWLYGVARNVLAHRKRGARRHNRLLSRVSGFERPEVVGPEPEVLRGLEGRQVIAALSSLRPDDQELLLLSYWEGLTHKQIGEVLGCSKSAVDSRVHRALERMRNAMRRSGNEWGGQISEPSTVREQP